MRSGSRLANWVTRPVQSKKATKRMLRVLSRSFPMRPRSPTRRFQIRFAGQGQSVGNLPRLFAHEVRQPLAALVGNQPAGGPQRDNQHAREAKHQLALQSDAAYAAAQGRGEGVMPGSAPRNQSARSGRGRICGRIPRVHAHRQHSTA